MDTAIVTAIPECSIPVVAGCVAFGSTLALSTFFQKVVGISTATRIAPSFLGMATVCVASLVSQHAAIANHEWVQQRYYNPTKTRKSLPELASSTFTRKEYFEVAGLSVPLHDFRVCALGLIAFKLLGGRFWAISPSSYTHLVSGLDGVVT
jgi:hypothetical protein